MSNSPKGPEDFSRLLDAAWKIISRFNPTSNKDDLRKHLGYGLVFVDRQKNFKSSGRYGVLTPKQKAAAEKFEDALHRLQMALRGMREENLHLSAFIEFPMDEKRIEIWRKRAEEAANTNLDNKRALDKPEHRAAVKQAATLLRRYNIELTATRPAKPAGRAGAFCQMAAVLSGDPSANLYHEVCRYLKPASKS